jgi:hypothetical protein
MGAVPRSIVEPTCGRGAFVTAAADAFPTAERVVGFDINQSHLSAACQASQLQASRVTLCRADFFSTDWPGIVRPELGPWLVIGNPPWVTSAELGSLASTNLPAKSNFQGRKGLDAITGKANFDISESMLLKALDWLCEQRGMIAVLCKTTVARKVLAHAWTSHIPVSAALMFKIDALAEFGAAVDACFFVMALGEDAPNKECSVFDSLDAPEPRQRIGFDGRYLISDLELFSRTKALAGNDPKYVWRSGVKHDCSKIMELRYEGDALVNGFNESVQIERAATLPLLKSSDIGNRRITPRAEMVIPQRFVGQATDYLRTEYPSAWRYLTSHSAALDARGSSIYRNNPRFSIFGVGPYTFAPWKVAISGFYKRLEFVIVGPVDGRPVVFDDTVYFLSCSSQEEALFVHDLLTSQAALGFYESNVHWDEKRPVTVGLLKRLSLRKVADALGHGDKYSRFAGSLAFSRAA